DEVRLLATGVETIPAADRGQVFRLGVLDAAIGWTGVFFLVAAAAAFVGRSLRSRQWGEFSAFWLYLVLIGIPVNLLPVRSYCLYGSLGQTLHPYVCLAGVLVTGWLRTLSPPLRIGLIVVWLLECAGRTGYLLWFQTRPIPQ